MQGRDALEKFARSKVGVVVRGQKESRPKVIDAETGSAPSILDNYPLISSLEALSVDDLGPLDDPNSDRTVQKKEDVEAFFRSFMEPLASDKDLQELQSIVLHGSSFLGGTAPCCILMTRRHVHQFFWHLNHINVKIKVLPLDTTNSLTPSLSA